MAETNSRAPITVSFHYSSKSELQASDLFTKRLPIQKVLTNQRDKTSSLRMAMYNLPKPVDVIFENDFAAFEPLQETFRSTRAYFPSNNRPYLSNEGSAKIAFIENVLNPLADLLNPTVVEVQVETPIPNNPYALKCDISLLNDKNKICVVVEVKPWDYLLNLRPDSTENEITHALQECVDPRQRNCVPGQVTATTQKCENGDVGDTQFNFRKGIKQLLKYMYCLNKQKTFGILTTYCHVYFAILEHQEDDNITAQVSKAVRYNDTDVLKRVNQFISLALETEPVEIKNKLYSVKVSPTKKNLKDEQRKYPKTRASVKRNNEIGNQMKANGSAGESKRACYGDYTVAAMIGKGRTGNVLRLVDSEGQVIAAKTVGEMKEKTNYEREEIISELHNEELIYTKLAELQGLIVPHMYMTAYIDGAVESLLMEELAADPIWKVEPTEKQKGAILEALKQIHRKKILHCDIRKENILLDRRNPKKVYFIDFGWSKVSHVEEDFKTEMKELRLLLHMD